MKSFCFRVNDCEKGTEGGTLFYSRWNTVLNEREWYNLLRSSISTTQTALNFTLIFAGKAFVCGMNLIIITWCNMTHIIVYVCLDVNGLWNKNCEPTHVAYLFLPFIPFHLYYFRNVAINVYMYIFYWIYCNLWNLILDLGISQRVHFQKDVIKI